MFLADGGLHRSKDEETCLASTFLDQFQRSRGVGSIGGVRRKDCFQPRRVGAEIKPQSLLVPLLRFHVIDRIVYVTFCRGGLHSPAALLLEVKPAQPVAESRFLRQVPSGIRDDRYPFHCLNPLTIQERFYELAKRRSVQAGGSLNETMERVQISQSLMQIVVNQG